MILVNNMKYSIYFNNNNANKTILTVLEELNNTFFLKIQV